MKIEEIEVGGFYVAGSHYPYVVKVLAVIPAGGLCLIQVVGSGYSGYMLRPEAFTERVTEGLEALEEMCEIAKANAQTARVGHEDDSASHPARLSSTLSRAREIAGKLAR